MLSISTESLMDTLNQKREKTLVPSLIITGNCLYFLQGFWANFD